MIITGGFYVPRVVSRYDRQGWGEDLPELTVGRYNHACASYDDGHETILLVTGGHAVNDNLRSTELFKNGAWSLVGEIPFRIEGLRAATLGNIVYVSGKISYF